MKTVTLNLPYGIKIEASPGCAFLSGSNLEREFYVPDDDLGSKAEAGRIAFECVVLAFIAAGFDVNSDAGRRAIESAA